MYSLIHIHPDFLLISKDPGIPFHKGTLPMGLTEKIRKDLQVTELYPLHRLDSVTSGLLLFARNRAATQELANQFRTHQLEKYYIALSGTQPKKKQGTIKGDMVKGRNGSWLLTRTCHNPSITRFFSAGLGNGNRLYLLKLETGKTHQARVALKSLGVPVLGDHLYNKNSTDADRVYLHAFALRFTLGHSQYRFTHLPTTGIHFNTDAFKRGMDQFSEPWDLPWPGF